MKHELSKLPKWAQDELLHLRSLMANFRPRQNEADKPTAIWREEWVPSVPPLKPGSTHVRYYIPDDHITFNTQGTPDEYGAITVHITKDKELHIASSFDRLAIIPQASNVVLVRVAGR
jgi:hypothetical protein